MRKKEKREVEDKKESNKGKKFFYIFLSILSVVMIVMAIVSFIHGEPKYAISNGIIFVFVLRAILLVFDSIESLNVGNVLSLKTKVKEKEKEVDKLNAENTQLRNQFISVMNTTLKQNVYVGYPKDYVVTEADKKEDSEEEEETIQADPQMTTDTNTTDGQLRNHYNRRAWLSRIEEHLIKRFQEENNIAEINLRKDIKIANIGVASDPIIDKDIIYDAYVKRPIDEIFVEVTPGLMPSSSFEFKLYFMVSRVFYYSQSNKVKAKMMLLLPKFTESYISNHPEDFRHYPPNRLAQRLKGIYAPAIQNDLLEIIEIELSDDEMKLIENEIMK